MSVQLCSSSAALLKGLAGLCFCVLFPNLTIMVTNLFLCNLIIFSCSASLVLSDYSISSYVIFTLLLHLNDCSLHRLLAWKSCLTCSICWQSHYFISIHDLAKGMDHRTLIFGPQSLHSEAIIFLLMLTKLSALALSWFLLLLHQQILFAKLRVSLILASLSLIPLFLFLNPARPLLGDSSLGRTYFLLFLVWLILAWISHLWNADFTSTYTVNLFHLQSPHRSPAVALVSFREAFPWSCLLFLGALLPHTSLFAMKPATAGYRHNFSCLAFSLYLTAVLPQQYL